MYYIGIINLTKEFKMMRYTVSLNITKAEYDVLELIKQKGIKTIDVFRRGMDAYEREIIDALPGAHKAKYIVRGAPQRGSGALPETTAPRKSVSTNDSNIGM
jgi:hypothetical protein